MESGPKYIYCSLYNKFPPLAGEGKKSRQKVPSFFPVDGDSLNPTPQECVSKTATSRVEKIVADDAKGEERSETARGRLKKEKQRKRGIERGVKTR